MGRTPELIHCATACLACSGSVSLELLYHHKPTVIHYQISRTAFAVQRFFRKVRFITLVNLLASDDRYCQRGEAYDPSRDRVPFPEYLTSDDRSGRHGRRSAPLVARSRGIRGYGRSVGRACERSLPSRARHGGRPRTLTVSYPNLLGGCALTICRVVRPETKASPGFERRTGRARIRRQWPAYSAP